MDRLQELKEQAARAERLASCVGDALTAERLKAYALECRQQIERLATGQAVAA